jgi:hypothetical protein
MTAGSWFKAAKPSIDFGMAKRSIDIPVGAVYRHRLSGNAIETATVLGVEKDFMGIPHVVYELAVGKSGLPTYCDRRTLSLESFANYFEEAQTA